MFGFPKDKALCKVSGAFVVCRSYQAVSSKGLGL